MPVPLTEKNVKERQLDLMDYLAKQKDIPKLQEGGNVYADYDYTTGLPEDHQGFVEGLASGDIDVSAGSPEREAYDTYVSDFANTYEGDDQYYYESAGGVLRQASSPEDLAKQIYAYGAKPVTSQGTHADTVNVYRGAQAEGEAGLGFTPDYLESGVGLTPEEVAAQAQRSEILSQEDIDSGARDFSDPVLISTGDGRVVTVERQNAIDQGLDYFETTWDKDTGQTTAMSTATTAIGNEPVWVVNQTTGEVTQVLRNAAEAAGDNVKIYHQDAAGAEAYSDSFPIWYVDENGNVVKTTRGDAKTKVDSKGNPVKLYTSEEEAKRGTKPIYDPEVNPDIGWDLDYSVYYEARGISRFSATPGADPVPTTIEQLIKIGAKRAYLPQLFYPGPEMGGEPAIPVYVHMTPATTGFPAIPELITVYDTQGYILTKGNLPVNAFTVQDFTYLKNSEIPNPDDPDPDPDPDPGDPPPVTETFDPVKYSAEQIEKPTLPEGTEFKYTDQKFADDEKMTLPEGAKLDPELEAALAQGTATIADLPVVKDANTYTAEEIYNQIRRFAGENSVIDREVIQQLADPSLQSLVLNPAADEIIARNPNTYMVDADELPSRRGMISDQPVQILGADGQVIGVIPAGAEIPTAATIQALGTEALNLIDRPESDFISDEDAARRQQSEVTDAEKVAATEGGQILERALGQDTADLSPTELAAAPAVEEVTGIVGEYFPQAIEGNVEALDTVRGQLALLMEDFTDDNTPDWAAGSIRVANQIMAERGLGNSSIAAATIVQAAQEAALPIAQADAQVYANMNLTNLANKNKFALDNAAAARNFRLSDLSNAQQTELANSAQRYALLGATLSNYQAAMLANAQMQNALQEQDLTRGQQEQVVNAARFAELENMNLTNEQQTRIANQANNLQVDMANLSVKEKAILAELQVQAALEGQELDNIQQTNIIKASRYAEAGNLDFNSEQNRVFSNSKMMETLNIDNLEFDQLRTLQNAANYSTMDTANLNNRQTAQVENAKNFLSMNLANLTNDQQSTILYSQQLQQGLLSDQAAQNAALQFNATSQNQVDQFYDNLIADIAKHNTAQMNAMDQFNAGQENALNQFNTTLKNQREQFNAKNALEIEQSNVNYRRELNTVNTAGINAQNQLNTQNALNISAQALADVWQQYRDEASYAWNSAQNAEDRKFNLAMAVMQAELQQKFFDDTMKYNTAAGFASFITDIVGSVLSMPDE